jgi:hypothetical protein
VGVPDFSAKLDLVLKALAISRGRLAQDLGVDKSLVSRWVSGTNAPSGHNLSNLTALIAARHPGFTGLDWDLGLDELIVRFAGDRPRPEPPGPAGLPIRGLGFAREETAGRGDAYDGFWTATRASFSRPGGFIREQVLIRRRDGLITLRCGGRGFEWSGWLLMLSGQLYGIASDTRFDSMVFYVLNGAPGERADVVDGLIVSCAMDRGGQTPTAGRVVFERAEPLSGDEAADDARFEARKTHPFAVERDELDSGLLEHLLSPAVAPAGFGDILMRLPWDASLARGVAD